MFIGLNIIFQPLSFSCSTRLTLIFTSVGIITQRGHIYYDIYLL